MSLQRVRDLVGDELDFLSFLITGVTPDSLSALIDKTYDQLNAVLVTKLCNVSLIAMATNRANVTDYLSKTENTDISRFIVANLYIQNHVNFAALNLLGHLLLAGGLGSKSNFVTEFRKKLGGQSIWHVNISRSYLSVKQKKILEEKIRRLPRDQVIPTARAIVTKLTEKKIQAAVPPNEMRMNPPLERDAATFVGPTIATAKQTTVHLGIGASSGAIAGEVPRDAEQQRMREDVLKKTADDAAEAARIEAETREKEAADVRVHGEENLEAQVDEETLAKQAADEEARREAERKAAQEAAERVQNEVGNGAEEKKTKKAKPAEIERQRKKAAARKLKDAGGRKGKAESKAAGEDKQSAMGEAIESETSSADKKRKLEDNVTCGKIGTRSVMKKSRLMLSWLGKLKK